MRHAVMAAFVAATLFGAAATQGAPGNGSAIAALDRSNEAVLVVAGDSRIVASFREEQSDFILTMRLNLPELGDMVVETEARLVDGQSHRIIAAAGDGDSFTFTRRGARIEVVAFDPAQDPELAYLAR